ncbi:MAG: tRNA (N(6)-L-threonylcarbamoyladenosine(37)-C(2))-methylthiotransferase MtaB [Butyrivibrio sp.]|nr:tRNA (N(6)-L-threonylcarbamoyladenosine(37)-C(2))-methylthiotransferase MtaB [Butyrivibrio sp.]
MKKRVALHNLGCKVNAYELDKTAESLIARGYEIVPFSAEADIYIVNTCTVTNIADRKSRQMLHRAKKNNPQALVVALGCYVDTDRDGIGTDPRIDIALGNKDKAALAEVLETYMNADEEPERASCSHENAESTGYRSRTRAYLKIQDGCNLFCSYCIIPYARGRSVSRPADDVLREARELAAQGVKEIVLTGIHISSYGPDFPHLLTAINEIRGIERIRLGSLEPRLITEDLVRVMREADKLCPHFHLSLQSGCDAVLKRMRRRYTTAEYAQSVALLRKAFDNPALTTDIIVGFPGETEPEFEESRAFVEQTAFYETHVFPFSVRKRTAAANMEDHLTQKEKALRADVMIHMSARNAKAYREGFTGRALSVLWEETETIGGKAYLTGHTERYVKAALPIAREETAGVSGDAPPYARPGFITPVTAEGFLTDEILLAGTLSR